MDVSSNDERWIKLNQVWLSNENLLRFFNEHFDLLLGKIDWLNSEVWRISPDVVTHLQQSVNDIV